MAIIASMFDSFKEFTGPDFFFWFCALAGSGMFIIQMLLSFVMGIDQEAGEDAGSVKWLSKQAIAGFLMMFGWTALTCQKEFGLPKTLTIIIALAIGAATMFITGLIFKTAKKLHSSGAVFRLEETIGKEAIVYHRIPKDGQGKISISLNYLTHEIDATSAEEIPSFTPVQIIKKLKDNNTVVVRRLS